MLEYIVMLNFYTKISVKDFISFSSVNKHLYNNYHNDEVIWKYYCIKKFSNIFWNRAQLHPEFSWKLCLNNILNFEHKIKEMKYPKLNEDFYFGFWDIKGW
jgi:hypothetical protein